MRLIGAQDVLVFAHTGLANNTDTVSIPGFRCMVNASRPYDSKAGGVAMYVKHGIPASLAASHPEYGIVWCKIYDMYFCGCYIPHADSNYLYHEEGALSLLNHFDTLTEDISKFQSMGSIVMMGDMNSRTNTDLDYLALDTDEAILLQCQKHCPRQNQDKGITNKSGGHLLSLCMSAGLMILNGRATGDPTGKHTFFADGRVGNSTIDYVITSPDLFQPSTTLQVVPFDKCPQLPLVKFDHVPVLLGLHVANNSEIKPEIISKPKCDQIIKPKLKWEDSFIPALPNCIAYDYEVNALLDLAVECDGPIDLAVDKLLEAIRWKLAFLELRLESMGPVRGALRTRGLMIDARQLGMLLN